MSIMENGMEPVCQRDGHGRFEKGASGNPAGKPRAGAYARLLSAAAKVGAQVIVMAPAEPTTATPPTTPRPA